jgi:DNA-binding SARP family transcriptional activator
LEFRVLGPLEVIDADQPVALGGSQQRLVLALLLLSSPEAISADRLIDELWGEQPPASAQHAVQVYVSGIRKLLGSSDEVAVRTTPAGYVIDVAPELIDARRFERLLGDAQNALAEDPSRAQSLFEEALALWRGPPLAEYGQSELARLEADRLDELRTLALEGAAEAGLTRGEHGEAISAIRALVAANPLRERPRRLLMLALYRSGRHAEALSAYRDACAALDEIGLRPGPELRELEAAILRHDESLRPATGARSGSSTRGDDGAPIPLPPRLQELPATGFVGRVPERERLGELFREASQGKRRLALVSGEPGIGKTRLASYAAHHAHSEGADVLLGACSEELAVPYEPWIQICTHVVEHAPQGLLERHLESHGGELSRLVRKLSQRIPDLPARQSSDPETERYLLFNAVAGLLEEVAQTVTLCVVLDDLHWADAQSLALLKHLLRALEQGSLQLIATFRDSELGKDHPLTAVLADLRRLEGVQRVVLRGLGADEVAEIMAAAAGHELEAGGVELATQIAAETDGNPFFVGEILRRLSESGALTFDERAQRWSIDTSAGIALPESVREVIERRVERLDPQAVEVLRQAAVMGRAFDVHLLAASSEVGEGPLLDYLEAAVAAQLLSESTERVGEFRFVHALINQTLYEGLGATRRARMHQRVAQALEELYGQDPGEHLAELALHWRLAAVSVDKAKAAEYALRAGQRALENLAPAEALKLFADAVELTGDGDGPERCRALIGLGQAQVQTGQPAYRETLLEASRVASGLKDGQLAASAALANQRGAPGSSVYGEVDQERIEAIERALELDDPTHSARLLALESQELTWDSDLTRRIALAEEAIELARRAGDKQALAAVLLSAFGGVWSAETLQLRCAFADELAGCTREIRDPAIELGAAQLAVCTRVERGDLQRANAELRRLQALADQLGRPSLKWFATCYAACWELMGGRFPRGERLAELALQVGQEAGQPDAQLIYAGHLALLRVYQGRAGEVIDLLEESVSAFRGIPAFRGAFISALAWLDRIDEANAHLEDAARDRFEHMSPSVAKLTGLALYAEAAALTRDVKAAAALYERIAPFSDQIVWNSATGYGHMRLWLGLLSAVGGEQERSDEHLAFACEFHEANDMPLWTARGHLGWSEALAARGDAAGAREHATRALELAREHGYGVFEPRAAALVETESAAGA